MAFTQSSKIQDFVLLNLKIKQESRIYKTTYQFQARSENLKYKISQARFKNDKISRFSCQWEQNTPSEPNPTLIFKLILGLHTLLNHFSLLNVVKTIKICSIKNSIFKISSSKNQARLQIPISYQARIKQDFPFFSSYQARIKQEKSC